MRHGGVNCDSRSPWDIKRPILRCHPDETKSEPRQNCIKELAYLPALMILNGGRLSSTPKFPRIPRLRYGIYNEAFCCRSCRRVGRRRPHRPCPCSGKCDYRPSLCLTLRNLHVVWLYSLAFPLDLPPAPSSLPSPLPPRGLAPAIPVPTSDIGIYSLAPVTPGKRHHQLSKCRSGINCLCRSVYREYVLKRDGINVANNAACAATSGTWKSPYDNETETEATEMDIDHLVALKNAWIVSSPPSTPP